MPKSDRVSVFEVGPRDGLQNEARVLPTRHKLRFIQGIVDAGLMDLELGAFVRPDRVPQMADTGKIFAAIRDGSLDLGRARGWSLVPNRKGLERALEVGVTRIAVFTACTEAFARRNIGMSIAGSLSEFRAVIEEGRRALGKKLEVRGYVSTAFGCPFEGKVRPARALGVIERLAALGVDQLSIGDTIGVGTPADVDAVIKPALRMLGRRMTAAHFHDTRGTALANAFRAYELGVRIFDSSAGGLGGCPFAPSASGNLATEDLVYMFNGMGVRHGVDIERLARVSLEMNRRLGRPISSRYLQTVAARLGRRGRG